MASSSSASRSSIPVERVFVDDPMPDDIDDDDEITRIMLNRLKGFRKKPMTGEEMRAAQDKILEAFGDAPTDTRSSNGQDAKDGMTGPFIIMCGKLADAVTPVRYKPSTASNKRIQRALYPLTADLMRSLLYTTSEGVFATIRYMIESGITSRTARNDQALIANSGARSEDRLTVQKMIGLVEKMTGFGLEGAIAARAQGVLCLVFDHLDTASFAALVVLRISKDAIPPISAANGSILGADFGYELFDAPYLTRDDTSNSPWATLPAAYVDIFYFDRMDAPYGRLIADTRNS
jgi:hypothetical protein